MKIWLLEMNENQFIKAKNGKKLDMAIGRGRFRAQIRENVENVNQVSCLSIVEGNVNEKEVMKVLPTKNGY